MTDRTNLTPLDWVIAGIAALAEGGIDAVRVERLARVLRTTKGSFYWHFADRSALLLAMLDLWEREGTADLIEFHGNDALVTFGSGGKEISALVPARECPEQSAPVRYTFDKESIHLFDAQTGKSLRRQ